MKRWLLILLVLLLPLQLSWAATGAYCADAHGAIEQMAEADEEHHAEPATPLAGEPGCQHCHGHGLSLPASLPLLPAFYGVAECAAEPVLPGLQALQPRPERPQWLRLA